MRKKIPPLAIDYVIDDTNLHLLSIIEYKRNEYIGIIDNVTSSTVKVYLMDHDKPNSLSSNELLSQAIYWYYQSSAKHPLSVELAIQGLSPLTSAMYRSFDINGISRIVGNVFEFPDLTKNIVKRRRVLPIQEGIEIKLKKN